MGEMMFASPRQTSFSPVLYTDEQRVMQVLLNLQSNALKFTQYGSVTIKAKLL